MVSRSVKTNIVREKSTGAPDNEEAAQRYRDGEPGKRLGRDLLILCLIALLLLFLSIATFSLNRICVNDFDKLILVFGFLAFVAFVSSMASFAAVSVYRNS